MKRKHIILITLMALSFGCGCFPHYLQEDLEISLGDEIHFKRRKIKVLRTTGQGTTITNSELKRALDALSSQITLKKNETICDIIVRSPTRVDISTLIETAERKKQRLEAIRNKRLWLASEGRVFSMIKKNGKWILESEGRWIS